MEEEKRIVRISKGPAGWSCFNVYCLEKWLNASGRWSKDISFAPTRSVIVHLLNRDLGPDGWEDENALGDLISLVEDAAHEDHD